MTQVYDQVLHSIGRAEKSQEDKIFHFRNARPWITYRSLIATVMLAPDVRFVVLDVSCLPMPKEIPTNPCYIHC